MIKTVDLVKSFDSFNALNGVNINVKKGCVYGLVGPNGAGKTTLIKTLMSIYKKTKGQIFIDGREDISSDDLKQRIIYISDDLYFFPSYSIKDCKKLYKDIYKNFDDETFERLKDIFKIDVTKKFRKLSKGMQKQVAMWLGLCVNPDLMILDEPVDGLDPVARRCIMGLVLEQVEKGMTVLISSHNLRELEDVCDYVGIMHKGKIVIEKSLDDVKGNIHKVQVAFSDDNVLYEKELDILKEEKFGSVKMLIVRGDAEKIKKTLSALNPLIMDILPLSLEEVFIYQLGGMGYEFENIL